MESKDKLIRTILSHAGIEQNTTKFDENYKALSVMHTYELQASVEAIIAAHS